MGQSIWPVIGLYFYRIHLTYFSYAKLIITLKKRTPVVKLHVIVAYRWSLECWSKIIVIHGWILIWLNCVPIHTELVKHWKLSWKRMFQNTSVVAGQIHLACTNITSSKVKTFWRQALSFQKQTYLTIECWKCLFLFIIRISSLN